MKWVLVIIGSFLVMIVGFHCRESAKANSQTAPKDLNEAIKYFENKWSESEKNEYKKKAETNAVTELHFSTGLWIRNNWIRGVRDKSLLDFFIKLGIRSPDDMSSIILTSLHRKLDHKPIDLQQQVAACKAAWKPVLECEKKARENAYRTYGKFKVGDPVAIYMYVDTSNGNRNAETFSRPTVDWKFDPQKDLLIKGWVAEKYTIGSDSNGFFKVKIQEMNFHDVPILMEDAKVGQIYSFPLENLVIK
jgi:hypothetical protein